MNPIGMLPVEIAYSTASLISAYTIIYQWWPRVGVLLGFFMQFAWIHLWLTTGQNGIILMDIGILLVYSGRIIKYLKEIK